MKNSKEICDEIKALLIGNKKSHYEQCEDIMRMLKSVTAGKELMDKHPTEYTALAQTFTDCKIPIPNASAHALKCIDRFVVPGKLHTLTDGLIKLVIGIEYFGLADKIKRNVREAKTHEMSNFTNKAFPNKFDYTHGFYHNDQTIMLIICKRCETQLLQTPSAHLTMKEPCFQCVLYNQTVDEINNANTYTYTNNIANVKTNTNTTNTTNTKTFSNIDFGKTNVGHTGHTGHVSSSSSSIHWANVIPNLFVGSIFAVADQSFMISQRIKGIVDLSGSAQHLKLLGVKTHKINVEDNPTANIKPYLNPAYDFMNDLISKGDAVLVFCRAGVSRSATVVLYYLMRKFGITYNEAYRMVKVKRNQVQPNNGFVDQLLQYTFPTVDFGSLEKC